MKLFYTLIVFTVILGSWHLNAFSQNVNFPDQNLASAIRSALRLATDAEIPETDLQGLTSLFLQSAGVTNLIGLEKATGLVNLALYSNSINNISPLGSLTALIHLDIGGNPISDFSPLKYLTNLKQLGLIETTFSDLDFAVLIPLTKLEGLRLGFNEISNIKDLPEFPNLTVLHLQHNQIRDITPLEELPNPTKLEELALNGNEIINITPLEGFTSLTQLFLNNNRITDVTPLAKLTNLEGRLYLNSNQIRNIIPLQNLTKLQRLYLSSNQITYLSPLQNLIELRTLTICYNSYTDISPLEHLTNLKFFFVDQEFNLNNPGLIDRMKEDHWPDILSIYYCPARPKTPVIDLLGEPKIDEPKIDEPKIDEPKIDEPKKRYVRCGLGWSPQSQYQHFGELPKVMIYALEFEYDPARNAGYSCKTIEIRTGDDSIENLTGWKLYLGTRYNPSSVPLTIPEEYSQITDGILRVTPEMLGLETFPCSNVYVSGQSLPSIRYDLKNEKDVIVDIAYSCFVWGQIAVTTVNGVNVKSQRRISSAALREMETPRIERYITKPTGTFITYTGFENFAWDRPVLSDWLLPPSESSAPGAPSAIQRKLVTTWGALKKL